MEVLRELSVVNQENAPPCYVCKTKNNPFFGWRGRFFCSEACFRGELVRSVQQQHLEAQ